MLCAPSSRNSVENFIKEICYTMDRRRLAWLSLNSYSSPWKEKVKNDALECARGNAHSVREYFCNFAGGEKTRGGIRDGEAPQNAYCGSCAEFRFTLSTRELSFSRAQTVVRQARDIIFSAQPITALPIWRLPTKYIIQSTVLLPLRLDSLILH